jgi:hypothetical protein
MHLPTVDWPLCACGCGEPVPVRKAGCTARGYVKGEPCKYVAGHRSRTLRKTVVDGRMQCGRCSLAKPVEEFHRDSGRPTGLSSWCKECQHASYRRRYGPSSQRTWVSPAVRARVHSSAYRARKRGQFVEHVDPAVIYDRDQGVCGICEADGVDPEDFHVDHVVPLVRGGEHSYANTQLAHPPCNMRKRDRFG